jgi:PPOX class probable F420-dependent enzyme
MPTYGLRDTHTGPSPPDGRTSTSVGRVTATALPDEARALIESDAIAHVVTLDEDGSPQITAAWVGLDGDEIVIATLPDQRKLRNLRRDPRVALSIPSSTTNAWGLLEYLVVYGIARVTEGGAPEVLQDLAHTYLGPEVVFPNVPDPPPGYVTRITPERLGGVGPWNHPT